MKAGNQEARRGIGGLTLCGVLVMCGFGVLGGCAHPINIAPDIAKIEQAPDAQRIETSAGYYIAAERRDLSVTTAGGGGDKVRYQPYREIETGFYKMLTNVFKDVTLLKSPTDTEAIRKNALNFIVTPTISTESSSPSPFTWPPTRFTVNLSCDITDAEGKPVVNKSVVGEGMAEFDEFKADFSLAGKRAAQEALRKMQEALLKETPELRK